MPSTSFSPSSSDAPIPASSVDNSEELGGGEDQQNSMKFNHGDGKPSSRTPDGKTPTVTQAILPSSVVQNSPERFVIGDDDSFDEIDICDASAVETPKKNTQILEKPDSPASSKSFPAASGSRNPSANKSPLMFNANVSFDLASAYQPGFSVKAEVKSTSPVPCHYCPKMSCHSAVKTCLVCGASMCTEHLRPHLDSPVFKSHTLVPPVEDISSWRCQEHHEINRIYCQQCRMCVCTVCTVIGSHRNHVCISIREADKELRVGEGFLKLCVLVCACVRIYICMYV